MTQNPAQGAHLQQAQQRHSGAEPEAGATPSGRWAQAGTTVGASEARNALATEFAATLQRGAHGLCFSPHLEGQQPGDQISAAQIRSRLQVTRAHARWIRSFSCTDSHEQTPCIAHELGMKTLVGAWLGTDAAINERELQGVIEVARAGHADIVAVGNEVLLREDMSEDALLAHIQRVKAALPGVPVGDVDACCLFEKQPRIPAACDEVMTDCDPLCFGAFDEAWKIGAEADLGAYWGLRDAHGACKFHGVGADGQPRAAGSP